MKAKMVKILNMKVTVPTDERVLKNLKPVIDHISSGGNVVDVEHHIKVLKAWCDKEEQISLKRRVPPPPNAEARSQARKGRGAVVVPA
jgi:hypothetical protein